MKVCVISSTIFSVPLTNYGGLEAVAYERARGLAAKGHDVTLIAPTGSTCPGVKILAFGPPGRIPEKLAYAGYSYEDDNDRDEAGNKKMKRFGGYWPALPQFDVIVDDSWEKHSYLLKMEGALKAPILGVFHAPVNSMYGVWPPQCPGVGSGRVDKPCAVCISEDQASHLRALFQCDVRVAHNGIDIHQYAPMNVPRSDRFLFLARFSAIKGADLALEACYQAGVGLDLIGDTQITGEPAYFHQCQQMAKRESPGWDRSKGPQFRVMGGVSRTETVWWYSQAKAMLHPNMRFREPLGLAPLEAMACECPVIAWRYGALQETVKEGVSGWLVSSMDQLINAIRSVVNGGSEGMRKGAREWAKKFSLEVFVDRYDELIHEAVSTGGW